MRGKKGPEKCQVAGCEGKHCAFNLCNKHYKQSRRKKALENETYGIKDKNSCSIAGCYAQKEGRGLCQKHYKRLWRRGFTDTSNIKDIR